MRTVAANESRANRSETPDVDASHQGILGHVTVRAKLNITQRRILVDGGVVFKARVADGAPIFDDHALHKSRTLNITVSSDLDSVSIKGRIDHTRTEANPGVRIFSFVL